jgi:phosphopantetheinyl transferase (holo-ACP synthase)
VIGNDIIDLNVAGKNSRWQEQRFLDKLFTQQEQEFILNDDLIYQNIWFLWSMKESAYKIHTRNLKSSNFNPKSYNCAITSKTIGTVSFDNHTVNTTTKYNSDIIYTTAHFKDTYCITKYLSLEGPSPVDKSQQLRKKAIQTFADMKSISEVMISIEKDKFGVPQLLINNKAQDISLSLTHHGNYGGVAITF